MTTTNIKLKTTVSFPASVVGDGGVVVTKANGEWTIDLDYTQFATITAPAVGDKVLMIGDTTRLVDASTFINSTNNLSVFSATTSAQLAGVLSDETGSGAAVFANAPTLISPVVGTQSPGDNTTKAASTAFVTAAVVASTSGVSSVNGQTGTLLLDGIPGGKLTLASATPVTETNVTAATTVYLAMADGLGTMIYDGSNWVPRQATGELSLALDSNSGHTGYHQSGKGYDLFEYWSGSAVVIGTGPAWSSDTSRGTGAGTTEVEVFQGRLVNKNSVTIRFGSASGNTVSVAARKANLRGGFRCTADGQTEDSFSKRLLWDLYRPVERFGRCVEATDNWTYSLTAFRQVNASPANQVAVFCGVSGRSCRVEAMNYATNSDSTLTPVMGGIGVDSSTVNSATRYKAAVVTNTSDLPAFAWYEGYLGIGYHEVRWLEMGNASGGDTQTWYGDNGGVYQQTGMVVRVLQ